MKLDHPFLSGEVEITTQQRVALLKRVDFSDLPVKALRLDHSVDLEEEVVLYGQIEKAEIARRTRNLPLCLWDTERGTFFVDPVSNAVLRVSQKLFGKDINLSDEHYLMNAGEFWDSLRFREKLQIPMTSIRGVRLNGKTHRLTKR